jgi:NAD(P)-dependent dehydrogenase (short-subunit alcohol dehydrogenase family)
MRLQNKVAIVTGGAKGIGRAICELFAHEGAKVIVVDIDFDGGMETVSLIEKNGNRAIFMGADVSMEEEARRITFTAVRELGKINILVNNAAEFILKDMGGLTKGDWDRTIAVNLQGPFFCIKHAAPEMKKAGGGSIVNIGSVAGMTALPNHMPYGPSKGALIAMTRDIAQELGPSNIRVNCLSPGGTLTPATYRAIKEWNITMEDIQKNMEEVTFLRRIAQPAEIANAALFLASDDASYVTGVNLMVDGGWTAH